MTVPNELGDTFEGFPFYIGEKTTLQIKIIKFN